MNLCYWREFVVFVVGNRVAELEIYLLITKVKFATNKFPVLKHLKQYWDNFQESLCDVKRNNGEDLGMTLAMLTCAMHNFLGVYDR